MKENLDESDPKEKLTSVINEDGLNKNSSDYRISMTSVVSQVESDEKFIKRERNKSLILVVFLLILDFFVSVGILIPVYIHT